MVFTGPAARIPAEAPQHADAPLGTRGSRAKANRVRLRRASFYLRWSGTGRFRSMHDAEMIAQELSVLGHKLDDLEKRLAAVEKVNTRLEDAALTTARALGEISGHWDAVYEAMRRRDESQEAAEH